MFENCVAYSNGTLSTNGTSGTGDKNGFKLGGEGIPVNHIVRNSIAFNNGHHGFTDNNNLGSIEMSNNTSVNNADTNFNFRTGGTHQFRNNVSYNCPNSDKKTGDDIGFSNVWWINKKSNNGRVPAIVSSAADFVTLTPPAVLKNADGSPKFGEFLALAASSDFIDVGVVAPGITFNGAAPDLGARESGPLQTTDFVLTTAANPVVGGTFTVSPNNPMYDAGTVVTLTATPAQDDEFLSWTIGTTTVNTTTTTVTMDANKTATANFKSTLPAAYVLTATANPTNGGSITINPVKPTYSEGEIVTLTAVPATGYEFIKWSNNATTSTINVLMTSDLAIEAIFSLPVTGTQTIRIEDDAVITSGYCGADGTRSANAGANNGFVTNLSNSLGKGVNYKIKVPVAGVYSIVFRYVNSSTNNPTTAKVIVNGTDAIQNMSFPKTANSTTFTTTVPANITLVQGVNAIRLETIFASAFADIDWVEITGEAPVAESCSSSPTLGVNVVDQNTFGAVVSPNPVINNINLMVDSKKALNATITLHNANGQLLLTKKQILAAGQTQVVLHEKKLSSGLYYVTIQSDEAKKSLKIIVK